MATSLLVIQNSLSYLGLVFIEDRDIMLKTAETLKELSTRKELPLVFKSSFQKDNRSSVDYYQGPGIEGRSEAFTGN